MVGGQPRHRAGQLRQRRPRRQPQVRHADSRRRRPWRQRRTQQAGRVGDQRELLWLILRHEALQADDLGHQWQWLHPRDDGRRRRGVRGQDVHGVGIGQRVRSQVRQGAHGLGRGILQVQRIAVERQARQRRETEPGHDAADRQDGPTAPRDQPVQRRGPGEPDFPRSGTGTEQHQRRRQEDQRAAERDQHARAGDQAKLGHAAEVCRHESQEPRRRGCGRHQDLHPGRRPVAPSAVRRS